MGSTQDNDDDDDDDYDGSMNIVTFATLVSVQPKLYMISLYHGTKTRDSFFKNQHGILQLLDKRQKNLVPLLGKRSGYEEGYQKHAACRDGGYSWGTVRVPVHSSHLFATEDLDNDDANGKDATCDRIRHFDGIRVLPKCQSYIAVKLIQTMEAGDHEMALCEVVGVGEWDDSRECVVNVSVGEDGSGTAAKDETHVLYTGYLRKEGIL